MTTKTNPPAAGPYTIKQPYTSSKSLRGGFTLGVNIYTDIREPKAAQDNPKKGGTHD